MPASKNPDLNKQLDQLLAADHLNSSGNRCACCAAPYEGAIQHVLEQAAKTQQAVNGSSIYRVIKKVYPELPVKLAAFRNHLREHEQDLWNLTNNPNREVKSD